MRISQRENFPFQLYIQLTTTQTIANSSVSITSSCAHMMILPRSLFNQFVSLTSLDILKQHTKSVEIKQYALKLMENTGSFEYTRKHLAKTEKSARDEIARLGGNPKLDGLLDLLHVKE